MSNNQTITNDLAGNYIAAMMDLNEFNLDLNFEQSKYLASIMVTMQKTVIDGIITTSNDFTIDSLLQEKLLTMQNQHDDLHKLICCYDQENLNSFNLPE
jgi:hypothetical protein